MSPIPADIMAAAVKCAETVCRNLEYDDVALEVGVIAQALLAERERCGNVIDAEREWGGDLPEASKRIWKGDAPRVIPGWNAPYPEDEQ